MRKLYISTDPKLMLAAAVRVNVLPSLGDWMGSQFAAGATVEDVQRQLTAALWQIGRVNKFCAQRESEVV
jgi:hypothetical protein